MSAAATDGVTVRPHPRQLFGSWVWDCVLCVVATLPLMIPFGIIGAVTQPATQREDRWRFVTMPESDAGLLAWAASQRDLKDLRAERPPISGQLVLRYERGQSAGPARPDWESLGYKQAYLMSATHPPEGIMDRAPEWFWIFGFVGTFVVGAVAFYRLRISYRLGGTLIRLADRPSPGWWKWLLASIAAIVLINLIQIALLRPFGIDPLAPDEMMRALGKATGLPLAAAFLGMVVTTPVAEEILFRGLLLGRFGTHGYWRAGIFVSALVFMLIHADPTHSIELFGAGLVLALLYQRTGSLWPPIALHAMNNAASFALVVFGKQS